MASNEEKRIAQYFSPFVEIIVSFGISLILLYVDLPTVGVTVGLVGTLLSLNRALINRHHHDHYQLIENKIGTIGKIVEIESDEKLEGMLKLTNSYLKITEQEYWSLRNGIVLTAREKLDDLKRTGQSAELTPREGYLLSGPKFEEGREIMAVHFLNTPDSRPFLNGNDLDADWDPYLQFNLKAVEKGAIIKRIFIVDWSRESNRKNIKANWVKAHTKEEREKRERQAAKDVKKGVGSLTGYYMDIEQFRRQDDRLEEAFGQGFVLIKTKEGERLLMKDKYYMDPNNPDIPIAYKVIACYRKEELNNIEQYFTSLTKSVLRELSDSIISSHG